MDPLLPWFPKVGAPYIVFERWDGDDLDNLDFFIPLTPSFLETPDLSEDLRTLAEVLLSWGGHIHLEFDSPRTGLSAPGVFFSVKTPEERKSLEKHLAFEWREDAQWVGVFLGRGDLVWRENVKHSHSFLVYENKSPTPVAKEVFSSCSPRWVQKLQIPGSTVHHYKIPLIPGGKRKAYFIMKASG